MVAIEFGMCRSVRIGGASGSVIGGKRKLGERRGGTWCRGGNRLLLGDQEAVGCDAYRGVVMEAAPASAFEVAEAELLLELLVVALDAPAQLGEIDHAHPGNVVGKSGEPILGGLLLGFRPFDQLKKLRKFRPNLTDGVFHGSIGAVAGTELVGVAKSPPRRLQETPI